MKSCLDQHGEKFMNNTSKFEILEKLGVGKDGKVYLCRNIKTGRTHIVKYWSEYGKKYREHSILLGKKLSEYKDQKGYIHPTLINYIAKSDYIEYPCETPYVHITDLSDNWLAQVSQLCDMNSWLIDKFGLLLWDFGFVNGKNYMIDRSTNQVKWVDYGGAGIYRTSGCRDTVVLTPYPDKKVLVNANSDFIMCQFLFHLDYHACEYFNIPTTIGTYSSLIQVTPELLKQTTDWILPNILQIPISKILHKETKELDWTASSTWNVIKQSLLINSRQWKVTQVNDSSTTI